MSDTKTKTIVALYGRVSTEHQALHGDSLADQRDTLLRWAQSMGWEIFDLYIDQGITGGIDERPELQRLRRDARAGHFNLVAVSELDRFYRENRLLSNCIHEFDEEHIGFLSQKEGIDTRVPGMTRVYLAMLGSMAQNLSLPFSITLELHNLDSSPLTNGVKDIVGDPNERNQQRMTSGADCAKIAES